MKILKLAKSRSIWIGLLLSLAAIESGRTEQFGPFTYEVVGETIEITGYPPNLAGPVEVPGEIDGKPVTSIGESAFFFRPEVTSVTLPPTITNIGIRAFEACTGLVDINVPVGVTALGERAFLDCFSLQSISIPSTVQSIGRQAFCDCRVMTAVVIPEGVTSVGESAFQNCRLLDSVVIPSTVTALARRLFVGCNNLASITIPESVTTIGEEAFHECLSLASITIPASVTEVGDEAFNRCSGLTSVTIEAELTTLNAAVFQNCTSLAALTIPESVETIGSAAFSGCSLLTAITIPERVTTISESAFRWCTALTGITIPSGVTSIGRRCFWDCESLSSVTLPDNLTTLEPSAFGFCTALAEVTIPSSVTTIDDRCFVGCTELTSVTLPRDLVTLGVLPFDSCSGLQSLEVEGGNASFSSVEGVLFNFDQTELVQYPVGRVGAYSVPDGVEVMRPASLATSPALTSVWVPASVNTMPPSVFGNCASLEAIHVQPGNSSFQSFDGVLFTAGLGVLVYYPQARSGPFSVPPGTSAIGDGAFYYCEQSLGVVIPSSVTSIGVSAFRDCLGLTALYLEGDAPSLGASALLSEGSGLLAFRLGGTSGYPIASSPSFPVVTIDGTQLPVAAWMMRHGIPPTTSLGADPNGDGVSLLMAYALDLDPHADLQKELPVPEVDPATVSLSFLATRPDLDYSVETSLDLEAWTTEGVTLSVPDLDGRVTATVARGSGERFLRLAVIHDGPGTASLRESDLKISFEASAVGSASGDGTGGALDSLAWYGGGGAVVVDEAGHPAAPAAPGRALLVHELTSGNPNDNSLALMSETIDLGGVPNEEVRVGIDLRTFEDSSGSNFEMDDWVEAWLEGSKDGHVFSRLPDAAVIPRVSGDINRRTVDPPDPNTDDLKKLERPDGAYTSFVLESPFAIPADIRYVRLHLVADNSSATEYFFLDNICVEWTGR